MTDETTPVRGDYSSRQAFLEDLSIARSMGHLRDASLFWETVTAVVTENTELRTAVTSLETRVASLEAIISNGS